jgi:hypothetical protein
MQAYWGVEVQFHPVLTSALDGDVSLKPWLLYTWAHSPWQALYRRLGRPQRGPEHFGECNKPTMLYTIKTEATH